MNTPYFADPSVPCRRAALFVLGALAVAVTLGALLAVPDARATELPVVNLTIKDARFQPETVVVPTDQKFQLVIRNDGPGAEEFESAELNRERVVPPGKSITLFLGPLGAGEYGFFGDFHPDTAKGKLVAK